MEMRTPCYMRLEPLIYLIPPIAGLIYARSKEYKLFQKVIVTIVLVFTFYYGFASGTRNVFATYVITFAGVYFLAKPEFNLRQALLLGVPMLVILFFATVYMLEFRKIRSQQFFVRTSRLGCRFLSTITL